MLRSSTIQLLRFPFSFFLLPVYLFAISQTPHPNWWRALLIFIVLHMLVYPASNGYNSYMDRDKGSIGGLEKPMMPTKQLFRVTVIMDVVSLALGSLISFYFMAGLLAYILASRAYSYRGIRLKKYAIAGYLTVICFQGAVVFWLVYHGSHIPVTNRVPATAMIAASLLIGSFYPLTQVYQHEADASDGINSISRLLGYRGTFIFTALVYLIAMLALLFYFFPRHEITKFIVLATCFLPVCVYFFNWAGQVWKDTSAAGYRNAMRMNLLASCCTSLGFLVLIIWNCFE